jgi:anionic cell wall polymer biosynthesis LytR-Cps2A-Psr (LCP) family protein
VRTKKADASIFLLVIIAALLGAGIVFTILTLRQDPIEEALSGDRVVNTLFVFEEAGKPLSSYVLMYYPGTGRAAVFDIPGELGLIIRQINRVDRIDTVYDSRRIGPFKEEIAGLLGIEINFYVIFDTGSLGKTVDLIEGVEIFIPSPVEVYDAEAPVLFPSGVTRLDGDKAKLYISYRLPGEEAESAHFRRQRFFLGFIKRLGEKNSALKDPSVNQVYQLLLKTDMNQRTRQRLFDEFAGIDTDRIAIQSVGGNIREVSDQELIFPYYDGSLIKEIVRQSLVALTRQNEGAVSERIFTVEVLNGTSVTGLAGRTAELLRGFGYDVIAIGNADSGDREITEIIDRSGFEDVVRTFAGIIRCNNIRYETAVDDTVGIGLGLDIQNLEYKSDFTLIIGRDFNGRYVAGE